VHRMITMHAHPRETDGRTDGQILSGKQTNVMATARWFAIWKHRMLCKTHSTNSQLNAYSSENIGGIRHTSTFFLHLRHSADSSIAAPPCWVVYCWNRWTNTRHLHLHWHQGKRQSLDSGTRGTVQLAAKYAVPRLSLPRLSFAFI